MDRLSSSDVGNLFVDRAGMPFHVGLLARLDAPGTTGTVLTESIAAVVETRLSLVPRLRQTVVWPRFGCGRPYWWDCAGFAIGDHVRHVGVDAPGDEAALLRTIARIDAELLDRSRPLWELWVLTGLAGDGAAVFFKLHHAVADGIAAVATLGALLDPAPGDGPGPPGKAWTPARPPPTWTLVADNIGGRARDIAHAAAYALHPVASAAHAAAVVRSAVADLRGSRGTPRCSINAALGPHRTVTLIDVPLADVRAAGHAVGGSVNDVVLAAVAGGLRALFAGRRERPRGPVSVSVPMSMRTRDDAGGGNQVAVEWIPVPVDDADDARVLRRIADTTRARKRLGRVSGYNALASELVPLRLRRWIMDRFATSNQRMVNLFVTNVPGPPALLRLGGHRILDAYPVAPLAGNVTVGVAVLSYAGVLYTVVHADPDANPDIDVMAAGMRSTFAHLLDTVDLRGA